MTQPVCYAVLTGDVVKSSRLPPGQLEAVRSSMLGAADAIRGWKRGLVKGRLEFFRGDAWQMLLTDPAMAMRAGIFLRASLLAGGEADSRIAIGLGTVERISSSRVSLSTGEAFALSGHGLDKMTQYSRMTVEVTKAAGPLSDWLSASSHLCDALIGQWTRRQAEIVCAAVDPRERDQEEIARTLRPAISKQAVAKALNGASWYAIRETVRLFERTPWGALLRLRGRRQPKKVV